MTQQSSGMPLTEDLEGFDCTRGGCGQNIGHHEAMASHMLQVHGQSPRPEPDDPDFTGRTNAEVTRDDRTVGDQ